MLPFCFFSPSTHLQVNIDFYYVLMISTYGFDLSGELVQEARPTCSNRTALYRCTLDEGNLLTWILFRQSSQVDRADFHRFLRPEGYTENHMIDSVSLVYSVTSETPSYSVTLSIPDPVPLNGVRIDCNRDMLEIIAPNEGYYPQ